MGMVYISHTAHNEKNRDVFMQSYIFNDKFKHKYIQPQVKYMHNVCLNTKK